MSKRFAGICALLALLILGAACGEDATPTVAPDTSPKASEPIVEVMPTGMATDPPTPTPQPTKTAPPPTATPNAIPPTPQPAEIVSLPPATPDSTPMAPEPTETPTPSSETPEYNPAWEEFLQPYITWTLESLNGEPPIEGSLVTLQLSKNSLGGNDGCNHFGTFHLADDPPPLVASITHADESSAAGELFPHDFMSTQRFCPGISQQGDKYHSALEAGRSFRIENNQMEILDRNGQVTLVLVRQPPLRGDLPDLAGTQWRMRSNDTSIFLAFLNDRVIAGVGKCRDYIGRHSTSDRQLMIGVTSLGKSVQCWNDPIDSIWQAERYAVTGEDDSRKLTVGTRLGETLTLDALSSMPPNTSQGVWSLKSIVDLSSDYLGSGVKEEAIPGSAVTASFQENHISGSAGCNSYQAPLTIDEEAIYVGPVSKSAVSCRHLENFNDVIRQELRYLELLSQVTRGVTVADRLFLSAGTGIYLIFEAQ